MAGPKVAPPQADEWTKTKSIYVCTNEGCGEEIGFRPKRFCANCSTASARRRLAEENAATSSRLAELREKGQWIYADS